MRSGNGMKILALLILFLPVQIYSQDKINFNAETLSGRDIEFSEVIKSGPALVNFWALWCKPCRIEMKALKNLYEKYSEQGFNIIGINQDSPRSVAKVESFVSSQDIKYTIVLDPNKELFNMFNGQVVPLTLLYDKEGNVVYQNQGYLPGDEFKLEEEINKLLGTDE